MKRLSMLMNQKNEYCKNGHLTKDNLRSTRTPSNIPSMFLTDTFKNLKIYMEIQTIKERQNKPE